MLVKESIMKYDFVSLLNILPVSWLIKLVTEFDEIRYKKLYFISDRGKEIRYGWLHVRCLYTQTSPSILLIGLVQISLIELSINIYVYKYLHIINYVSQASVC